MTEDLREDPREHSDWRHHKNGCPHYRERWFPNSNPEAGEPMYQVFCLMNTPPTTLDEQEKCLVSRVRCWRLAAATSAASSPTASCTHAAPEAAQAH